MDDREQQRKIRHRLAVLRHAAEVTNDVSATCHQYGLSRPTFYDWLHRYEEGLRDRSSAPLPCPNETPADVVGKVVYLRQSFTEVAVEGRLSCGEVWFAEDVARRLDALLSEMLSTELVAVRPFSESTPTAA